MLEIPVHDHSCISARSSESCDDGRFFAEVAGEGDVSDMPAAEVFYRLQCIIRRAVIDEDDLMFFSDYVHHRPDFIMQNGAGPRFIKNMKYYCQHFSASTGFIK